MIKLNIELVKKNAMILVFTTPNFTNRTKISGMVKPNPVKPIW